MESALVERHELDHPSISGNQQVCGGRMRSLEIDNCAGDLRTGGKVHDDVFGGVHCFLAVVIGLIRRFEHITPPVLGM